MITVLGLLMACAGFGSAVSSLLAKERTNQRLGTALACLFLAGCAACLFLKMIGWS